MENTKMIGVALSILFTAICTIGIYAQTSNSQYVISAKAGGVNYTSGDVKTTRKDTTEALIVSIQDTLENGDQIQTGPDGRAEILLNPGSYLRLSENSTLEFTDTSFDSLRVKLRSGTAIVEVAGDDDELAPVELKIADAVLLFDKKGVYRVEYREPEIATVRIHKGRVGINGDEIGDGKEIVVDRGKVIGTAKFDMKEQDSFDLWSATRAESLAEANKKLSTDTVSRLFSSYSNAPFSRRRGFSGYWLFDPHFGSRIFLPYYSGWSSPYGHGYRPGFGVSHSGHGFWGKVFGGGTGIGVGTGRSRQRPIIIRHPVSHGRGRRH